MTTKVIVSFVINSSCKQVVNITDEAYKSMISSECPYWEKPKNWSHFTKERRLNNHLNRMKEYYGATDCEYEVLPD